MSEPLLVASILMALAAALHGVLGETAILRAAIGTPLPQLRLPRAFRFLALSTSAENIDLQWRYLRAGWHFLTIDFIFSTILFAVAAFTPSPALGLMVPVTAVRYTVYAIFWLLIVALHHRSIFRTPQWVLLLAIAGCAWLD